MGYTGDTTGLLDCDAGDGCYAGGSNGEIALTWVPPNNGDYTARISFADFDTGIRIEGSSPSAFDSTCNDDQDFGDENAAVNFKPLCASSPCDTVTIYVDGAQAGAEGTFELVIEPYVLECTGCGQEGCFDVMGC